MKKLFLFGLAALAGALLAGGSAKAQVTVQGSTSGFFDVAVTGLSFTGTNFSVVTKPGTPPSPPYTNLPPSYDWNGYAAVNLGTFTITGLPAGVPDGTISTFTLNVDFTAPVTTASDPSLYDPAQYQALVTGQIVSPDEGGAFVVQFNRATLSPIPFTFNNQTSYLVLNIPDVTIDPIDGTTKALKGQIATAITPEPGSLALLLPGLMPIGFAVRRRRSRQL
jgi:hypothetical protein